MHILNARPRGQAARHGATCRNALFTALAAAALAACGGGGGGTTESASTTPETPATTLAQTVRVIDGPISNALVCLDINRNGRCESSEPQARTDSSGNATLTVAVADAGRYPVVAIVGTDAVDADHGPVTVPFTLKAPADQPAVISPLTTLVDSVMQSTGVKSSEAAAAVQAQIGTQVSLFQDFTKGTGTDAKSLGALARMVVVTQQQQAEAVKSAVGTKAIDGSTITQADVDALVLARLQQMLPSIVQVLGSSAVQTALQSGNAGSLNTALVDQAKTLVASPSVGLQPGAMAIAVAVLKGAANPAAATDTATATSAPLVQLMSLSYTDAQTWTRRILTTSAAGSVANANGDIRYRSNILRSTSAGLAAWSSGLTPDRQSDLHWNGKAWVACGLQQENLSKTRDAQGRAAYDSCDGLDIGSSQRTVLDIAGTRMLDWYNQVRDAGYTNLFITNAATALGTATMPAGSKALFQVGTTTATALAYPPTIGNVVRLAGTAALASGNPTACAAVTPATPSGNYLSEPATLEALVASASGIPCSYVEDVVSGLNGATLRSGTRNEWWGASTVVVGVVGSGSLVSSSASATAYYSTNSILRVSFGPANAVTYWTCKQRAWDGSPRNCDALGTGSYTIETLGNARVMTLGGAPLALAQVSYERVLVEREGKVFLGYRSRPGTSIAARLNTTAANALFTQLGMPTATAEDLVTPTALTYTSDWTIWPASDGPTGWTSAKAKVVRLSLFGSTFNACFDTSAGTPTTATQCTVSADAATGTLTVTQGKSTGSFVVDTVTGMGTGTITDGTTTPATVSAWVVRRR